MILADPPFNILNIASDQNTITEMTNFADMAKYILQPNGVLFIFCSFQQYGDWYFILLKLGFDVLKYSIIFLMKPRPHTVKQIKIINSKYCAVFAVKKGERMWMYNITMQRTYLKGQYPSSSNVIDGYSGSKNKLRSNLGEGPIMRYEEKNVFVLEEIIARYINARNLVADLYAVTATTAIACLYTFRNFIGFEKDPIVAEQEKIRLFHVIHLFIYKKQFIANNEEKEGFSLSQDANKEIAKTHLGYSCNIPPKYTLIIDNDNDEDFILDNACKDFFVEVKSSPVDARGLFAGKDFAKGELIVPYFVKVYTEK